MRPDEFRRVAHSPSPHAEVLAEGEPRSAHDRFASFEAPLRGAPQDEERGNRRLGPHGALDPSPSGEGESASADRGEVLPGRDIPTPVRSFASTRPPLRGGIGPSEGLAPIQYRFERRDLWRLSRILYRPGWAKRLGPPLIALAFLLGMVIYGVGGWPNARQWTSLLKRPDIIAMTIALLVFWANMHLVSMAVLTARFHSLAIADKTIRLGFSEPGLDADVEGVASHIPWTKFTARIEEEDRVVLTIARWEAMTIPRRAFPDEASWQAVLAFLRRKVPHAG